MNVLKSMTTGSCMVSWVSTEWLEDHLYDPDLLIVDCRQQSHAYIQEHIPGAICLHEGLLRMHIGKSPVQWISPDAAHVLFSTLGIEEDHPIVVYSDSIPPARSSAVSGDGLEQTLIAYTFARFGCRNVMLLDGGLAKWRSENFPLSFEPGITRPSACTVEMQLDFLVGYEECQRLKDEENVILLDTRPYPLYAGRGPWPKPGHIPGAVSIPAAQLMYDDNSTLLKPEEEIRGILSSCGITPEKTIICSSGTGRSATAVFLILRYFLGYPDVLMYEAGFTEWASYPENPVVSGKYPR